MKKRFPVLLGVLIVWLASILQSFGQPLNPRCDIGQLVDYQDQITVPFLKKHLAVLSADSMEGRETGKPGQKKAAQYLAGRYREMGLKPVGDKSTYFQNFELGAHKRDSTVFKLYRGDKLVDRSVESRRSTARFYRSFGGSDTLSGEIVFAGFGVNDPRHGVQHLGNANLKGKWVMVFEQIPHLVEGETLIDQDIDERHRFTTLIREKGAAGMLLITGLTEQEFEATAERYSRLYSEPNRLGLPYLEEDKEEFTRGYDAVSPGMAARILGIENGRSGLDKYRRALIENIREFRSRDTGYSLSHIPYSSQVRVDTENVVALMEGSDPGLKDEAVILTSHYDHLGIGKADSTGDRIYNGADDDGSGTVALLNIARALAEARDDGCRPRRSILFLHVSAEEIGLLGSRYYSDHPVIPIEKTVANINIDMIGRVDPLHEMKEITDYSYIIGSDLISSELDSLLKTANERSGRIQFSQRYNDLQDPNQFYRRSDHWNFGRLRVPFVFFFTGVHEDYHRPSDEFDKIRFQKMAKIVRTIYATSILVAGEEDPPTVDNEEFIEITRSRPR